MEDAVRGGCTIEGKLARSAEPHFGNRNNTVMHELPWFRVGRRNGFRFGCRFGRVQVARRRSRGFSQNSPTVFCSYVIGTALANEAPPCQPAFLLCCGSPYRFHTEHAAMGFQEENNDGCRTNSFSL